MRKCVCECVCVGKLCPSIAQKIQDQRIIQTNRPAVVLIDFRYHLKDISVCNFDMHLFQNLLQLELHVALGLIFNYVRDCGMQNDTEKNFHTQNHTNKRILCAK